MHPCVTVAFAKIPTETVAFARPKGASDGSLHDPVSTHQAASCGPFPRAEGAVRGDAEESRIHPEQHSHHSAQAQIGEVIGAVERGGFGSAGRGRSRLHAEHRTPR